MASWRVPQESVGVARQCCGRLGKVDNCQTCVNASLVHGTSATIIDCRLYLPKKWTDDRDRCKVAGVPGDVTFKTKSQLVLDIVHHARSMGIRYAWVGIDSGYGKEPIFLKTLDDEGEQYVADVHTDQSFFS
nr:transposase [Desulfobulbus alkaliphilus]